MLALLIVIPISLADVNLCYSYNATRNDGYAIGSGLPSGQHAVWVVFNGTNKLDSLYVKNVGSIGNPNPICCSVWNLTGQSAPHKPDTKLTNWNCITASPYAWNLYNFSSENIVFYEQGFRALVCVGNHTRSDWLKWGMDSGVSGNRFGGYTNVPLQDLNDSSSFENNGVSGEPGNGGIWYYCDDIPSTVVNWQGYTPLNNSVMSSLEPIFFNHTDITPLNCSLWKNVTNIVEYNESIEGLSGFWRFEEGGGSLAIDSSTYNNNGTITGAIYNNSKGSNGTGSYALVFDGINDKVSIPDKPQLNLNESYTVSAWINPNKVTGLQTIISKSESIWELNMIIYNGVLMGGFEDCADVNYYGSGGTIVSDKWNHVLYTYNSTRVLGYVNGLEVFDVDGSGVPCLSHSPLGVGNTGAGLHYWFNGSIDEVMVFNHSLSDSEILDLYNNGLVITHENITTGFVTIQNISNVFGNTLYNFSDYCLCNNYYNLFVSCGDLNSSNKFIGVNGSVPRINFLNIQNFFVNSPLVQGGVYEFAEGVWNLSVNVTHATHYNFSFYNRTALESEVYDTGIINLQSSTFNNFVDKNLFNVSVIAYNSFGSNFGSLEFSINDTILPLCNGTLTNSYVMNDTDFIWNVSCIDELFFSFNMSCSNNYSFYQQDILSTTYFFNGSTRIRYNITCEYEFCDGHTKAKIDNFYIKKILENKSFIVEDKKLVLSHSVKDITWKKKTDRYEFCFDFESTAKLKQVDVLIPEGCHYVDTKWKGHLVCPDSRMWFDFENDNVKATITKDRVLLDLSKVKGNKVCFNSVGKFNCVSGVQKIGASYHVPFFTFQRFECDMSTTPKAISFIGILFFVLAIWIFALWSKIGILNLFVGFVWLWSITWQVSACFEFANLLMVIMGLVSIGAGLNYSYNAWTAH